MQATSIDFQGTDFVPIAKPAPSSSKGGFYSFGKNSKSAIVPPSKTELEQKKQKLDQFRGIIGAESVREANDLGMANERVIDLALKRASNQQHSKQLVELTSEEIKRQREEDTDVIIGIVGAQGDSNNIVGVANRPESAKPLSIQNGKAIAIKQLQWDEANTIYELDDEPQRPATKSGATQSTMTKNAGKPKRPTTAQIKQPQLNQKVNRPNQMRQVYKSQHVMDGDYEKAKSAAFDDNLVLAGNTKAIGTVVESMGQYNAQLVRKQKKQMAAADAQSSKDQLPSDRRAYA